MALSVEQLSLGPIGTNCYVVRRDTAAGEAVVVDPSGDATELRLRLAQLGTSCAAILITHGHWDHLVGVADLAEGTGAPVYMADGERALLENLRAFAPSTVSVRPYSPDVTLFGGESIDVAGLAFDVLSVPGHSPAHVAYHADDCLFSGDVLFAGSVGRADLPGADWETLLASIRMLVETLSARNGRLSGARADHDARGRARAEPVPRRASRGAHRVSRAPRIERPRGTHDVIPAEQPLWRRVTSEIERLCELYGYRPITTPVFEDTALFERTSGAGSDVVQKEMYTFTDRSDRSLTLRPEGTAPICRAYVEHGLHREPQPAKLFTIASMYRYGAPGRGRHREHWQASVEAIGSDDPSVDAELIQLYDALLGRLGVSRYHLELNSIGCRECRPAYLERLRSWLEANAARLDDATREKAATSPLRVFDNYQAKPDGVRAALDEAPKIGESLCATCSERFAIVQRDLDAVGVRYTLVPTLVRGLDYYSRTTWEFIGPLENENATLSGGGRYDYLVEEIGGPPTPGVGFGAGIERLLLAMDEEGVADADAPRTDVFFALEEEAPREQVAVWLAELRRRGVSCDTDYAGRSLKGQLTQAGRLGASVTVVVGADGATIRRAGERGRDRPARRASRETVGMSWRDPCAASRGPPTPGRC